MSNLKNISNITFLKAIFGDISGEYKPAFVSFKGDPQKDSYWTRLWNLSEIGDMSHNNYFTLSTFGPDKNGNYLAQNNSFHAIHVIVLDDVCISRTKVNKTQIDPKNVKTFLPKASYVLKTSKGNAQVGYILKEPVADMDKIKELGELLAKYQLSDPKTLHDLPTRLMRLPQGSNGKKSRLCSCELKKFEPELKYSLEELCKKMTTKQKSKEKAYAEEPKLSASYVLDLPPAQNPVLTALKDRDLYKGPSNKPGYHNIICPNHAEHTNKAETGAMYREPCSRYPMGVISCVHSHCKNLKTSNFLKMLRVNEMDAYGLPILTLKNNSAALHIEAIDALLNQTKQFYVLPDLTISQLQKGNHDYDYKLVPLTATNLKTFLSKNVLVTRFNRKMERVQYDPPASFLKEYLESTEHEGLQKINGIIYTPLIDEKTGIIVHKGYDKKTGFIGMYDTKYFDEVKLATKEQAVKALHRIEKLLGECSFASTKDKSAAIASILTAVIRPSIDYAPMILVTGPVYGAGKSYLVDIILSFNTPFEEQTVPTPLPKSEDEMKKSLLAQLRELPNYINFDNISEDIEPFPSLCMVITSSSFKDRIMTTSKTIEVPTRVLITASGNNIEVKRDLLRRCLPIRIDPHTEHPEMISYQQEPEKMVRAEPSYWQAQALTIIQAYLNSKEHVHCKALAGFNSWTHLVRKPLVWLGLDDPADTMVCNLRNDTEKQSMRIILKALYEEFQKKSFTSREVVEWLENNKDTEEGTIFIDLAVDNPEKINSKSLGRWLAKKVDFIAGGYVLQKRNNRQYKVARTSNERPARDNQSNVKKVKNA